MREITKSMFSLGWAMSLLGMREMARLVSPGRGDGSGVDAVTRAAAEQLGESLQATYRAGDALQRAVVDTAFDLVGGRSADGALARTGIDVVQRSLDLFNRGLALWSRGGVRGGEPLGWGPVRRPRVD